MQTRFWRKKNAGLKKRLSTVIETTERARKTLQPPPSRVTIDTTYVEQAWAAEDAAADVAAAPVEDTSCASPMAPDAEVHELPTEAAGDDALAAEIDHELDPQPDDPVFLVEQAALLDRAEAAERELSMLRAALEARDGAARATNASLQQETAARKAAETALAEATARFETAGQELAALRVAAARHERGEHERRGALEAEITTRRNAEAERDAAAHRAGEAEAALAAMQAAAAEACEAAAAARQEAEAERNAIALRLAEAEAGLAAGQASLAEEVARVAACNQSIEREGALRVAAEAERDEVLQRLRAIETDMTARAADGDAERLALRASLEARDGELREAALAVERELSARRTAEAERDEVLQRLRSIETDMTARAADGDAERLALRASLEARDGELREAALAVERELRARRTAEAERDEVLQRLRQIEREVEALRIRKDDQQSAPAETVRHAPAGEVPEAAAPTPTPPRAASRLARKVQPVAGVAAEITSPAVAKTARPETVRAGQAEAAPTLPEKPADKRKVRRVASQMPASLWREGMGQPLVCTLRDRSPSGARVEFQRHMLIEGVAAFNVGDHATLTLNSAHERTWVGCEVVWVSGNACGVRFLGQFRSEGPAPRKTMRAAPAADKGARAKGGSRLGAVFTGKG